MVNTTVQQEGKHCTVAWLLAPWLTIPSTKLISGMTLDSRAVKSGDLFVALQGAVTDGRIYIAKAIQVGAAAVLSETDDIAANGTVRIEQNIPIIQIYQLGKYLSAISMRFYFPQSQTHQITAITGTNGKTTIASLLANSYELLGNKSAQMGTIGNGLYGQLQTSLNTTLDAISVCRELQIIKNKALNIRSWKCHHMVYYKAEFLLFHLIPLSLLTLLVITLITMAPCKLMQMLKRNYLKSFH